MKQSEAAGQDRGVELLLQVCAGSCSGCRLCRQRVGCSVRVRRVVVRGAGGASASGGGDARTAEWLRRGLRWEASPHLYFALGEINCSSRA